MKAVVTGGTGFIGSALVGRLARDGWELVVPARSKVRRPERPNRIAPRFVSGPEDMFDLIVRSAPDLVFHLATHYLRSHTSSDIHALTESNIELGTYVLEAAAELGVPVVIASSFFQYRHGNPEPISLYASMKQAYTGIADYYREQRHVDVRNVVLYDTYGPRDLREKVVPLLVARTISDEPLALGSPEQRINLTYIDDVVTGLVAAADAGSEATTTVSQRQSVAIPEVVRAIEIASGRTLRVTFDAKAAPNPRVDEAGDWPFPAGWEPVTSLQEGLRLTWAAGGQPTN